jgi:cardiolipin synthase
MSILEFIRNYWPVIAAGISVLHVVLTIFTIFWALSIKRDSMSAMAWCLTVILMPFLGTFLFYVFGYQHVYRPLKRKRQHKHEFHQHRIRDKSEHHTEHPHFPPRWAGLARLGQHLDAFMPALGNSVQFYHEGVSAYAAKLEAIRSAQHHVHLEYFIFQPDEAGQTFVNALIDKARQGVKVRLIYDAMGSHRLTSRFLRPLREAGGVCEPFLPLNPWRRRMQINMRNHRKILVVDGRVAFSGGLNIGDEYLGKVPRFGFWRDTSFRLEGPAVTDLQHVFAEDWDFAADELLADSEYFPKQNECGSLPIQVIQSGPDQNLNSVREIYFAAILRARKRLWIASPYFVPDAGIHDALCLAGRSGVDVRLLGLKHPDKWLPFLACRYYWTDMLEAGVKVYQYAKGMMHSKIVLVDGQFASVGTANLDNRSLHLNFEVNCLFYDDKVAEELETQFERDLLDSEQVIAKDYPKRPLPSRMAENVCRLLSPVL